MSNIAPNLRYLRRKKGLTQQQFADLMEIKRSLVGAYEEYRAEPKYDLLKKMATFFDISMDELANDTINDKWESKRKEKESLVRVLTITVDKENRENIELVPVKASAGYLGGYADPEFIGDLPKFNLPMLNQGSYRAFELTGDSMPPFETGTIVIAEFLEEWTDIKPGQTYIVVSKSEGIVYKRAVYKFKPETGLKLSSNNPKYHDFWLESSDLLEIWKAKAFIGTNFPEPKVSIEPTLKDLDKMFSEIQNTIMSMKDKIINKNDL